MCVLCEAGLASEAWVDEAPVGAPDAAVSPLPQSGVVESVPYDTDPNDADQDTDALIAGSRWTLSTVTFSFADAATDYGYGTAQNNNFDQLSAAAQTEMQTIFDAVAALTGTDFEELGDDVGENDADAIVKIAHTDATNTGFAYYPNAFESGGDIWLRNSTPSWASDAYWDTSGFDLATPGTWGNFTLWHELGHALGLKHGHETSGPGAMTSEHDAMEFSVMTYRSFVGGGTSGYSNETYGYAQSFMMYDIAALQRLYGADFTTNSGDTTYSFSTGTGEMFVDGVGQGAAGANRIFRTIWDGDGEDTYDLSNYASDLQIDLNPGASSDFSADGTAQNARLGSGQYAQGHVYNALKFEGDDRSMIENAIGGSGDDRIRGNQIANRIEGGEGDDLLIGKGNHDTLDGGAGRDKLWGSGGNDHLIDGAGRDKLWGGGKTDRFEFVRDTDRDVIRDWEKGEIIDISAWGLADMNDVRIKEKSAELLVIVEKGGTESLAILNNDGGLSASDIDASVLILA